GVPAMKAPGLAAGAGVAGGSNEPALVSASKRPSPSSIAWYSTTKSAPASMSSSSSFQL
ncbi:hypothetical protein E2562_028169, partial [Oryza meyeriana var. granulata]